MPHTYRLGSLVVGPISTPDDHVARGRAWATGGIAGLVARVETALALSSDRHVRVFDHERDPRGRRGRGARLSRGRLGRVLHPGLRTG